MPVDVQRWLDELGLRAYGPAFAQNDIDGETLPTLTHADLKELGVASLGHRKKLLAAIAALQGQPVSHDPGPLAEPEGERKLVTVLFADIVDSTDLVRTTAAETARAVLDSAVRAMTAATKRYEGTVLRIQGDGIFAVFGAPLAREDDAVRACRAAIEMVQAVEAATGERAPSVRMRVGLHSGEVVVSQTTDSTGRASLDVFGPPVWLAARMEQSAIPGTVRITAGTLHLCQGLVDVEALGPVAAKGFPDPVDAYRLLAAQRERRTESRARNIGIGSVLVGRDSELAALRERLEALIRGEGAIVVLAGEPGLGKSRLVAEAKRHVHVDQWLWLESRGISFGRSLSYWPFTEILKRCFAIEEDDTEDQSWSKLEQGVRALFAESTPEVVPYLATVLALRVPTEYEDRVKYLDSQGLGRQVFLSMRRLFERLAQRQPVVLLFEDWHWADRSSVGLAEHLLPLTVTVPLLMWCVTRPDPEGPIARIRLVAAESPTYRFHEIVLSPLPEAHSATLIGNLVGMLELPAALREQILEKTEGNPFFIEEVVRSLVAEGVLTRGRRNQSWHLARAVDRLILPDTIHGLILARIDRLDDELKQVLKLASVIGRSFLHRVLLAVSEAKHELEGSLSQLEHAEFIRLRQRVPEVEYVFKHALVQEAAYSTILAERRRAIHRRVADAIEKLFTGRLEEFASVLAYHYTRAEDWQKAQEYLFKAGDRSGRVAGDAEALEHFRQAEAAYLKAFGDKLSALQRASLDRKVGQALRGSGQHIQALEHFRRALSHLGYRYPTSRWSVRRATVGYLFVHLLRRAMWNLGWTGRRDLQLVTGQEIGAITMPMVQIDTFRDEERMFLDCLIALDAGERSGDAVAEVEGLAALSVIFTLSGAYRLARRYAGRAVALAERIRDARALGIAYLGLGILEGRKTSWEESIRLFEKSAAAFQQAGDVHGWGGATLLRSIYVHFRGELSCATALGTQLLQVGRDAADRQVQCWASSALGCVGLAHGPLDEIMAALVNGRETARRIASLRDQALGLGLLGKCYVRQGRLDEALAVLSEATRIIESNRLRGAPCAVPMSGLAEAWLCVAERHTENKSRRQALQHAQSACRRALRYAQQPPAWLPEVLRLHGTLAWLSDDQQSAQERWQQSIRLAERFAFPIERGRTLLEMGRRLGDATLVEQAARTLSQVDAKVDLASALHALAQINARSGAKAAVTLERYEQAIAALDEVKADYELALACVEHGRLQQQTGELERARANFARALTLFEVTGTSVEQENLQKDLRRFHPAREAV